jgi:hypothetical protein
MGIDVGLAGEIVVGGHFHDETDLGEGRRVGDSTRNAFIAKYSPQGVLTWSFDFGCSAGTGVWDVRLDPLGGVYATGIVNCRLQVERSGRARVDQATERAYPR